MYHYLIIKIAIVPFHNSQLSYLIHIIKSMQSSSKHKASAGLKIFCLKNGYELGEFINQGSFASVYKGVNKKSQQIVALKCMNVHQLIELEKNAQAKRLKIQLLKSQYQVMMKCTQSPYILKCYDMFEDNIWRVLVLKYCNGGTLYQKIDKGKLEEEEAVKILEQITSGFAALHTQHIIHRDLKTENILIHNQSIKIADFGLAKEVESLITTRSEDSVGSRFSMAPEVKKGLGYDFSADIWSLGVIYYEMVTGFLPFDGEVTDDSIKIFKNNVQTLKISKQSKDFLEKVLVIDPLKRMKWIVLYKMLNNRTGVFHILPNKEEQEEQQTQIKEETTSRPQNQEKFCSPDQDPNKQSPEDQQNNQAQSSFQLDSGVKGSKEISGSGDEFYDCIAQSSEEISSKKQHQQQEHLQMSCQEYRSTNCNRFEKLIDNFQRIKTIYDRVVEPLSQVRFKDFSTKLNAQLEQSINYFYHMVCSQLQTIVKENQIHQFVDLEDIQKYGAQVTDMRNYSEMLETAITTSFNRLYSRNTSNFTDNGKLNIPTLKDIQPKYVLSTCQESQHIEKTKQLFSQIAIKIDQSGSRQLSSIFKDLKQFIPNQYQRIIKQRKR